MKMEKHLKISFKTPIKFSELTSFSMNRFHPVQRWKAHKGTDYALERNSISTTASGIE
jgi:murein DD-endopeptidase MepM/ murein hydrolase activator NlpD